MIDLNYLGFGARVGFVEVSSVLHERTRALSRR